MRRKQLSSAFALAGIVSTLFFVTTDSAQSAQTGTARNFVRQPFLSRPAKELIAYAPPATANGGDYLAAVSTNGTHRWSAERMPLKVCIEDGARVPGYRDSFKALLSKSFDEWCRISAGKLSWQEVASPDQADIVCNYNDTPRKAGPAGFEAGVTNTIIQQNRYTGQSSIQSAQMTILTQWRGRVFSDKEIYMTSLHEVGHAMGMQGHSNVPSDIMYSTVNQQQTPVLTQRDANTVARLYKSYGTEPTIAYNGRRNSGNYPQLAPRSAVDRNPYGSAVEQNPYASEQNPYRGSAGFGAGGSGTGAPGSGRSKSQVIEGDVQPFTPVDVQSDQFGAGGSGSDQYGSGGNQYGSGSDQYGSGGNQYGSGGYQYGSGNQYGANNSSGNGFRGAYGGGGGWHRGGGHRRARWSTLDPAQRAAMMARRQQMQEQMMQQGVMPGDGFMQQNGFMPGSMMQNGFAPGPGGMMQDGF